MLDWPALRMRRVETLSRATSNGNQCGLWSVRCRLRAWKVKVGALNRVASEFAAAA
jgi:predicted RecB family endonuclease